MTAQYTEKILSPDRLHKGMFVTVLESQDDKSAFLNGSPLVVEEILLPYIVVVNIKGTFTFTYNLDTRIIAFMEITLEYVKSMVDDGDSKKAAEKLKEVMGMVAPEIQDGRKLDLT